jgi:hypothetical protein
MTALIFRLPHARPSKTRGPARVIRFALREPPQDPVLDRLLDEGELIRFPECYRVAGGER